MTQVGGVVSVLVVIAIIVLAGALVHRLDHDHDDDEDDDKDEYDDDVCSQTNAKVALILLTIIPFPDIDWFPDYEQG